MELNIFAPRKASNENVMVYIHGGNWNSGKKSLYNFLGTRFARKGIVTVVIDYPLSPEATYLEMSEASSLAIKWVKENIKKYGGNPDRIFVSGHSAGGHLAALISLDDVYFNSLQIPNPVKGIILIDAAGLDMYGYLKGEKFPKDHTYLKTFTQDSAGWKKATPLYHLRENMPPMLIYRAENTYPSIEKSHVKFIKALKARDAVYRYQVLKGKKHVTMITQFFRTWNPRYDEIISFMNTLK